jgi:hypothetical protein
LFEDTKPDEEMILWNEASELEANFFSLSDQAGKVDMGGNVLFP